MEEPSPVAEPISSEAPSDARTVDRDLLVEQYPWVRSVAHNLVRDCWGAEDVMQEAVLAALAAPPRHARDASSLRAWLGRVAFNLSRLGARQSLRRRAREERVARPEALPSVSDEVEAVTKLSRLLEAVAELDQPYRTVVELRYFDELSTAEIACRTGVSELAVRKRLWRARGKLRDALGEGDDGGLLALLVLPLLRAARPASVGAAAAAVLAVVGSVAWLGRDERQPVELLAARAAAPGAREAHLLGEAEGDAGAREPGSARDASRSRALVTLVDVPPVVTPPPRTETPMVAGSVRDLEAQPVAGLDIRAVERPEQSLAVSDAFGAFRVPFSAGTTLVAEGHGFTTLCPARAEQASATEPALVVVAPAAPLDGRVVDEHGALVRGAELEIRCDESTFVELDQPVRLDSPLLRSARSDEGGRFAWTDAPRGAGLTLRASAPGFEEARLETRALFESVVVVLRVPADAPELCGTVRRGDGLPAAGAFVQLSLATVRSDENGRYRLPLRGVQDDSVLEARHEDFACARVLHMGRQVRAGVRSLDVVLGDALDSVAGRLTDPRGAPLGGWRVFAFASSDGATGVPAQSSDSSADGAFRFRLPPGDYALVALEPHGPGFTQSLSRSTREASWSLEAADRATRAVGGRLVTDAGEVLAGAQLAVALRTDGRSAPWRELVTDLDGRWSMEIGDGAELDLVAEHPAIGTHAFSVDTGDDSTQALTRSSFLRVVATGADALAVLDDGGAELAFRGAIGTSAQHALFGGRSALLGVPAEARWLSLRTGGNEVARVRLVLQPGAHAVLVR